MNPLNIVISGKSPEAFSFFTKLSESHQHVFMNENTSTDHIDLLIIFEEFPPSLSSFVNDTTICFSFNSSVSINTPFFYQCHFRSPAEGEAQTYLSFIIDTEIQRIDRKFSHIYGSLVSIGYEITFNESRNPAFQHILTASSIQSQKGHDQQNDHQIVVCDPKRTQFHLIIALDCTGSMSGAIHSIQSSLLQIVSVIKQEFPKILISFYAFRDYCDRDVIRKNIFESDERKILSSIQLESASGGGDTPEAHKTCLAEIRDDIAKKCDEMTNVCFFITDAPPHLKGHSGTYQQEVQSLDKRGLSFACDWINLASVLSNDGIQVFSFLTNNENGTANSMSIMSQITHGLCFIIPDLCQVFEKQMISIVSSLMNESTAQTVEGIRMIVPNEDYENIQKEQEMMKLGVQTVTNKEEIKSALIQSGTLMRLTPSDRGARRVTISSSELFDTGVLAIKALQSLYQIILGNENGYIFFDETPKFKFISKQLKEKNPTSEWLTKSSLSCICSMMTIGDSFELIKDIDVYEIEKTKNITKIVEILGNFVIGYPFLFQLSEDGKFNMQDAWPIIFKDASIAYTMSISSLYHIISNANSQQSDDNKMINKFKDFITSKERSGIIPLCPDELAEFTFKILDVTKWLDALVSYGLHRHIEPLPAVTRATSCAFLINISRQAFFSKNHQLSSIQGEALKLVSQTLFSLKYSCENIMDEFIDSIKNQRIPFSAYSPQEPYICSTANKILNSFFQLNKLIGTCDHEYMQGFFFQGILELISLFSQFLHAEEKDALFLSIFDDIPVDVNKVTERNPLEETDPLLFKQFPFHEIENFKINRLCSFIFKVVWNLLREDEFEEPSKLMLTAALALAISTQTRSSKYQMIKKNDDSETTTQESTPKVATETETTTETATATTEADEKPKYEINPLFATQDPNQLLHISSFIYFTEKKKDSIKMLQANRKKYLTERAIEKIIDPFKNWRFDQFYAAITSGFAFDWMEVPFKLDVINTPMIVARLLEEVKEPNTEAKDFYESAFYLLFLGNDQKEHKWAVDTCRDIKMASTYNSHFLGGDQRTYKFYLDNRQRTLPNRHGHNSLLCPNQDEYTEEYARKRIICNMAPFYYFPELPKKVKNFDTALIKRLAHKKNAPPEEVIFNMALKLKKEIIISNPDCEKPPLPKKSSSRRRRSRPRRK